MAEPNEMFSEWLRTHSRGTLDDEVTAALADVVKHVHDVRKKGSVVLEVVVEPAGSSGRTLAIGGKLITKLPRPDAELSVYYPDMGGGLHREDPYQTRMPGREDAPQQAEEGGTS